MKYLGMVAAFALGACGGGEPDKQYGDPINDASTEAAAEQSVEAALAFNTLASDPTSDSALGALGGAFGGASTLIGAKFAATAQQQAAPALPKSEATFALLDENCVTATDTKVTYTNCDLDGGSLNGTIQVTDNGGGSVSLDVDIRMTEDSSNLDMTWTGAITASETSIVGGFAFKASAMAEGITLNYELSADYDMAITDGCATGGTAEFHGKFEAAGQGQSAKQEAWVLLTFGPACGDVVIQ